MSAGVLAPHRLAGLEHGLAEGQAVEQQPLVEALAEVARRLVVHGPAGDDHAAHADLDQLARHARGELVAAPAAAVDLAEVAAVQEHQVRHGLHRRDLGGGDQQPARQQHAAATPAVGVRQVEHAVRRDVQDAPGLRVQLREHPGGDLVGADRGHDLVAHAREHAADGLGLGLRAIERRRGLRRPAVDQREGVGEAGDRGVADHERAPLHALPHLRPEGAGRELADDGGAQRERPLVVVGAAALVGQHQLPRQVGGAGVDHEHDARQLPGRVLEVVRHHELEQHAAEVLVPGRVVDLLGDELLHQPRLALERDRFGAGALAHVGEAQAVGDRRRGLGAAGGGTPRAGWPSASPASASAMIRRGQ